jgi:tetratricopeptide (TPR) repeat protein
VPGGESDENKKIGQQAIEAFQLVLQRNPKNANSAKGIAGLYLQMKEFEKAKEYHQKVIQLEPNNPEPYYSIGNIDWWLLYIHKDYSPEKKTELINEGMQLLDKATQLNPRYDIAFFYVNLMHRQRAQVVLESFIMKNPKMKNQFPSPLDASSPIVEPYAKKLLPADIYAQFKGHLADADKSWEKAMQLRKENEAKAETKGVVDPNK